MQQNQEFQELLYKELELLKELNGLSLLKKDALLKDDLISLETIVLKEEALSKKLRTIDDACSPQVKFFLKGPSKAEAPVGELIENIHKTAFKLHHNNEFNKALIRDSLTLIQFTINFLTLPSIGGEVVYGSSGKMVENKKKNYVVDKKG